MSRISGSYLRQVKKLLRRSKAPKIIETSPPGEEGNHEKKLASPRAKNTL